MPRFPKGKLSLYEFQKQLKASQEIDREAIKLMESENLAFDDAYSRVLESRRELQSPEYRTPGIAKRAGVADSSVTDGGGRSGV